MNTKKYKHGFVTSLTALSTAILCQTTATYASDIEIYKAPTTGGAYIMLVLDFSTSMRGTSPIKTDFFNGNTCTAENMNVSTAWNGTSHSFQGQYCWLADSRQYDRSRIIRTYTQTLTQTKSDKGNKWGNETITESVATQTTEQLNEVAVNDFSNLSAAVKAKIINSCVSSTMTGAAQTDNSGTTKYSPANWNSISWNTVGNTRTKSRTATETGNISYRADLSKYSCPDRVTMLKKSMYDLIAGNSTVDGQTVTIEPLANTASIGFTKFPNPTVTQVPLVLNPVNRTTLLSEITGYTNSAGTPISHAYAVGSAGLMANMPTGSEASCAGYGVYFLTDGEPYDDNTTSARNAINGYLTAGNKVDSTNCSGSWPCVETIANNLHLERNTKNIKIKTAVVGFGNEFSFGAARYNPDITYKYTGDQTEGDTSDLRNFFTSGSNALAAAKAAVVGGGGWYSASNTNDVVTSVTNFVDSIKVPIPAITTGTSAIPQDALNTSVIQPYAYFPQFQPMPSEDFRAWTGNLKKYNVADGILKDKGNTALFTSAGVLNTANEDLWTPNYSAGTTLNADQQRIKLLGGLLSRLKLKKTDSTLNRKVFTSNGAIVTSITEGYIKDAPTTRGYYLGLLGYDITDAQVKALTNSFDLSTIPQTTSELRKMGAVMHSTPVLLTQSGAVAENSDGSVNTVNRDDYVLFGTTQGVLHVVKAGKSDEIYTVGNTAGEEVFAFVPQEMLSAQGKAFLDPPQTVGTDASSKGMNNLYYGVDGAWTAHTEYVYNNKDDTFRVYDAVTSKTGKQWVYGGLRMGGHSYYALDLTNMASPTVKFRINPATNSVDGFTTPSGETTRYANLGKMGQSWSKPTIANVQWKGKRRLVMFVGGGYDATGGSDGKGYETFNYNQDNGVGAGVYMFDANTGELLWSSYDAVKTPAVAEKTLIGDGDYLKYSVVSQIKGVDRDGDGDVDHLYFGDLGGQVFRVDLDSKHTASDTYANYAKQITRIYNGHVANGYSPRFYEMPAFTVYSDTGGLFAVISIGSGNRSTPLLGKVVNATTTNSGFITPNETATTNDLLRKDAIYNIYDKGVIASTPPEPETSPTIDALHQLTDTNRISAATLATWREVATVVGTGSSAVNYSAKSGWYYPFTSSVDVGGRKAVEKVQGDLIAIDNDLYVSTFDAEAVGTTESCGAGIYGASRAHRFCMPYGQCANGDTVANNTLNLGKGLLGITMGPGTTGADRRIVTPLGPTAGGNRITDIIYGAANKLISQSWYEKN